jgi:hypothetical protein
MSILRLASLAAAGLFVTPVLSSGWEIGDPVSPYIPGADGNYVGLVRLASGGTPLGGGYFHMKVGSGGKIKGKLTFGQYTGGMEKQLLDFPIVRNGLLTGWSSFFLIYSPPVWTDDWEYNWDGWQYTVSGDHSGSNEDDLLNLKMQASMDWTISGSRMVVNGTLEDVQTEPNGTVYSTWAAEMNGQAAGDFDRDHPSPQAGSWTMIIPGGDGITEPAGAGLVSVKVDPAGKVSVSGFLADGTQIAQKTLIGEDGSWPLFNRMYNKLGSISGWIDFAPAPGAGKGGMVVWIQPSRNKPPFASGFANTLAAEASPYQAPAKGGNPFGFSNGIVVLSYAGVGTPLTNSFHLDATGKIVCDHPETFSLKLTGNTGFFSGTARTASGTVYKYRGALLQEQRRGHGYFLNANKESGLVYLGPAA